MHDISSLLYVHVSPFLTSSSSDIIVIDRVTLWNGIKEVELLPINVLNSEIHFQPKVLKGERGLAAMRHLNILSKPTGG
jgi:hypothetical protein